MKAACEAMFADIAAARPIRVLFPRHFNPMGTGPKVRTGLQLAQRTHALGKVIRLGSRRSLLVTGTDYPARDGSIIRDYVDVWDLAEAHLTALGRFDALPGPTTAINLGTGRGITVRELADAFNPMADSPIQVREAGRSQVTSLAPIPAPAAWSPLVLAGTISRRRWLSFASVGHDP